jgi:DNA-binding transcriptional ArsR family regulator
MQDVFYIESPEQAAALLKPIRLEMLKWLDQPRTCPELAEQFGQSPQRIYYHIKALEKAGLVEKLEERPVRGVVEGVYRAKARSYWLASQLAGQVGGARPARDQLSLRYLLSLADELHADVGHLGEQVGQDIPSLGLSAQIYLPNGARRADFLRDVQRSFQTLAREYGLPADGAGPGETFRLMLACYPKEETT